MTKAPVWLALAFAALLAVTGCKDSSSTSNLVAHTNPTVAAATHQAEQRGLRIIEKCTPNGTAMIGSVVNKTATATTYIQVAKYFKPKVNRLKLWKCVTTQPGSAAVPGTGLKQKAENCFTTSAAFTAMINHPVHAVHYAKDTATALVNQAAVCAGRVA